MGGAECTSGRKLCMVMVVLVVVVVMMLVAVVEVVVAVGMSTIGAPPGGCHWRGDIRCSIWRGGGIRGGEEQGGVEVMVVRAAAVVVMAAAVVVAITVCTAAALTRVVVEARARARRQRRGGEPGLVPLSAMVLRSMLRAQHSHRAFMLQVLSQGGQAIRMMAALSVMAACPPLRIARPPLPPAAQPLPMKTLPRRPTHRRSTDNTIQRILTRPLVWRRVHWVGQGGDYQHWTMQGWRCERPQRRP
jgi:hypothetical protein